MLLEIKSEFESTRRIKEACVEKFNCYFEQSFTHFMEVGHADFSMNRKAWLGDHRRPT